MPTLPPARTPFGGRESHQAREIAESFGSDADRYDRARPRYPDALVDRIVAGAPRSGRNPEILDVGCGTGIVARQFHGRLAVFWNAFQPPPDLAESFAAVYRRVMPDSPLFRGGAGHGGPDAYRGPCAKAAEGMRQAGAFGEPEQWRFDWDRRYTRDEWLDQLPTSGFWAQIPAAGQREILAGIGAAVDAAGGSFAMRYATVAVTAERTGAA